jgi:predicted transcriptional regulator
LRSRDRIEIMSQILEGAKNGRSGDDSGSGATKTQLMFNAYLGHGQLKHYLSILADGGLIQYDSSSETFKTTEKGVRFLETYREIDEMIKIPPQQQQQYLVRKKYLSDEEESLELKTP